MKYKIEVLKRHTNLSETEIIEFALEYLITSLDKGIININECIFQPEN